MKATGLQCKADAILGYARRVTTTNGWARLALVLWLSLYAARTAASDDVYEGLLDAGLEAQENGDYVRAHGLFAQAHALLPNARTLRALGVVSYRAGQLARAVGELEAALEHPVKALDPELRSAVTELLARAREQLAWVVLNVVPDDARVNVDAASAELPARGELALDAGQHVLRFTADGHVPQTAALSLSPGARTSLTMALEPLPKPVAEPPPVFGSSEHNAASAPVEDLHTDKEVGHSSNLGSARVETQLLRRRRAALAMGGTSLGSLLTAALLFRAGQARVEEIARACRDSEVGGCSAVERNTQLRHAQLDRFELATNALLGVSAASLLGSAALAWWSFSGERRLELNADARNLQVRVIF